MTGKLALDGSLEAFFFDQVGEAQTRSGATLPPEVEAYVVHLLAAFVGKTAELGRRSGPLALQYLAARAEAGSARAQALRVLGDRALFIAGVVPHSLDRTPVNLRYVASLGASAYREVSDGHGALAAVATGLSVATHAHLGNVLDPDRHAALGADMAGLCRAGEQSEHNLL